MGVTSNELAKLCPGEEICVEMWVSSGSETKENPSTFTNWANGTWELDGTEWNGSHCMVGIQRKARLPLLFEASFLHSVTC